MIYVWAVVVPANTAQAAPVEEILELAPGQVERVALMFPPGCAGLVYCRILRELTQVWPRNPDSSFRGDSETITWAEDYGLWELPHTFTLRAWSLDDTYEHTIDVRINLLGTHRPGPAGLPAGITADVLNELGID